MILLWLRLWHDRCFLTRFGLVAEDQLIAEYGKTSPERPDESLGATVMTARATSRKNSAVIADQSAATSTPIAARLLRWVVRGAGRDRSSDPPSRGRRDSE